MYPPVSVFSEPFGGLIIVGNVTNKMGQDKGNSEPCYMFCFVVAKNRFGRSFWEFKKGERGTSTDTF